MGLGAVAAVVGILYTLTDRDIKKFLAHSAMRTTGTRDTDRVGGLIHRLPRSAVISVAGILGMRRCRRRTASSPND